MVQPKSMQRNIAPAVILIALGGAFLLNNLNVIPNHITDFIFNWKGILLLVGTVMLFNRDKRVPGIILIAISGYFLTRAFWSDFFGVEILSWQIFWPILIILGGVLLLLQRAKAPFLDSSGDDTSDENVINDTLIFWGKGILFTGQSFRGGSSTAIFGGAKYDFTQAELAPGIHELDITAIFGGMTLIVPEHWQVRLEVDSILGGFSDNRKHSLASVSTDAPTLVIKGTVIFGGGEITTGI